MLEELQGAADETGMKTLTAPRRASPLTRAVAVVAAMLVLFGGASAASHAASGDEGWWPEYAAPGFGYGGYSTIRWNDEWIVSGEFVEVDAGQLRWVARWNGFEWLPMGNGLASGLRDLTVFHDSLYGLAGSYHSPSPASLRHWNGTSWEIVAEQPTGISSLLEIERDELVASTSHQLYRWDGETWTPFGPTIEYEPDMVKWSGGVAAVLTTGQVVHVTADGATQLGNLGVTLHGLGVLGGKLTVGVRTGYEPEQDYRDVGCVRQWSGVEWVRMGPDFVDAAVAFRDRVDGPELVAEETSNYGGWDAMSLGRGRAVIRRWTGSEWAPTGAWFDWHVAEWRDFPEGPVATGAFQMVDGRAAPGMAVDTGSGYQRIATSASPRGGADGPVRALAAYDGQVVVGGSFIALGDAARPFLAIGDGRDWSSIGDGVDNGVFALTTFEGDLVAAGDFTMAGGRPAARIARWNGTNWTPFGDGFDERVVSLGVHDGKLYAGGWFRHSGTRSIDYLAMWNGSSWQSVGQPDRPVNAIASYKGRLHVGGEFRKIDGSSCPMLARLDEHSWTAITGIAGSVLALAVTDDQLAISGWFPDRDPGDDLPPVLFWDGATITTPPGRWWGTPGSALASTTRGLVVGGAFRSPDMTGALNLARWDGHAWQALGAGVDGQVLAITEVNGSVFVGGHFSKAGRKLSAYLARWSDGLVPAGIDGVTIDRDADEVRLSWRTVGTTNLSQVEVWLGGPASGDAATPVHGTAAMAGLAVSNPDRAFEFVDQSTRPDGARYWLRQLGPFGSDSWSGPYALAPLPPGARIQSIGPNPFFSATQVHYTLDRAGTVAIEVFDAQGRRIRVLQRGEQPAGVFEEEWDGRSESGADVASGTYWVRLATRDGIQSRRILRLR